MSAQIIYLHPDAPAKPAVGQACNGCGVCCMSEPCPLGALLSGKRRGACDMLRFSEAEGRYLCGAVQTARWWLPGRLAARWIAAGSGCDSAVETEAG